MSQLTPEFLRPLFARPVAIFGGGVSGEGVRALLGMLGVDSNLYDLKGVDFTSVSPTRHGLVVFSPGFIPDHPWLRRAREAGAECLGELDFASLFWRGAVVAITGTNGKTTLTEFLTHALGSMGRDAHATGNIGRPLSQLVANKRGGVKDMIAVCEVSSFQAETFRFFRADATLWTNFAEDHLERHLTLENYFSAKWNLVSSTVRPGGAEAPAAPVRPPQGPESSDKLRTSAREKGDREPVERPAGGLPVFVGSSVQRYAAKFDRPLGSAVVVSSENQPPDERLHGTVFAAYPQRENFLVAAAWWRAAGHDPNALYAAARTFRLGRHRLTRVIEYDGVTFWNDSKATNFHAVEAALAGFSGPVVLIAGGKSKGGDLAGFVHRIAPRVKHALLIGETSAELGFHCSTFRVAHTLCGSLAEAVRRAADFAVAGDHVLLSPGFASFDMFRSYEDRGLQFEQLVQNLPASSPNLS